MGVGCLLAVMLAVQLCAALTPTEQLAEQRRHQQEQQVAQQNARRVQTRRLPVPCVVPDDYYPLRTCRVSSSGAECARGW